MRKIILSLAAFSISSVAIARDYVEEYEYGAESLSEKTQVAYVHIDPDTLTSVIEDELEKSLDHKAWLSFDHAIEGGVEMMVVHKGTVTDYYIDTATKDLYLQAHADGRLYSFRWDGVHTGDDLRLREFYKADIRPLSIPKDKDAVIFIEASKTDLDSLYSKSFDEPSTYAFGGGASLGDTCSDPYYMLDDECTKKDLARNCCNAEAAKIELECLKDKAKTKRGVLAAGSALVAGGSIASVAGGGGVPVVMAGIGLIASGLVMDTAGECSVLRAANFATCQTEAYIALDVDPYSECPS